MIAVLLSVVVRKAMDRLAGGADVRDIPVTSVWTRLVPHVDVVDE
jgi:hypothetical protein